MSLPLAQLLQTVTICIITTRHNQISLMFSVLESGSATLATQSTRQYDQMKLKKWFHI